LVDDWLRFYINALVGAVVAPSGTIPKCIGPAAEGNHRR